MSLLRILALSFLSLATVNREVSLAKSFGLDFNSFDKPLMQTRKRIVPSIRYWGNPVKTSLHDYFCPFKITLWNLTERWFTKLSL